MNPKNPLNLRKRRGHNCCKIQLIIYFIRCICTEYIISNKKSTEMKTMHQTIVKELSLADIILLNTQYKVVPEIQYVRYSIEESNHVIGLQIPFQAEDYIRALICIRNPELDNKSVDSIAQRLLAHNPDMYTYIDAILQQAMRHIH